MACRRVDGLLMGAFSDTRMSLLYFASASHHCTLSLCPGWKRSWRMHASVSCLSTRQTTTLAPAPSNGALGCDAEAGSQTASEGGRRGRLSRFSATR